MSTHIQPVETLEVLNQRLKDRYGLFEDGQPKFRIVWAPDQLEKKHGYFTEKDEFGRILYQSQYKETREVKKYNYMKHPCFVLEVLLPVPEMTETDGLIEKKSYEPMWSYTDRAENAIAPTWLGTEFVIKCVEEATARKGHNAPSKMPEEMMQTPEAQKERILKLSKELYGNETTTGDALAKDSGVGYGIRQRNDW